VRPVSAIYVAPFELRRLVVKWSRVPSGVVIEDNVAATFHFAKLTAGAVDSNWLTADYTAVEGRFDTLWTALKVQYRSWVTLIEYRWYKSGPVWEPDDLANGPSNPAVRITARSVVGTSATASMLPPQVAMSVSEITPIRKRWGRFFLPAPSTAAIDADGRLSNIAGNLPALVTCYNGCRADGKQPVVFSRGRSAYTTSRGTDIAAHVASAYEITDLQMDNLFDVQRSRRWSMPTIRTRTALT